MYKQPGTYVTYSFRLWDLFLDLKFYKFLSDFFLRRTSVITSRKLILIDGELGGG